MIPALFLQLAVHAPGAAGQADEPIPLHRCLPGDGLPGLGRCGDGVQASARRGRSRSARSGWSQRSPRSRGEPCPRALCEKLPACASPLLPCAQEIEPHTGWHPGNFRQAFSHLPQPTRGIPMNAPNDNTTAKGLSGWWASPPRSGMRHIISRHGSTATFVPGQACALAVVSSRPALALLYSRRFPARGRFSERPCWRRGRRTSGSPPGS